MKDQNIGTSYYFLTNPIRSLFQTPEDVLQHRDGEEHKLELEKLRIVQEDFSPKPDAPIRGKRKPIEAPALYKPSKVARTGGATGSLHAPANLPACLR